MSLSFDLMISENPELQFRPISQSLWMGNAEPRSLLPGYFLLRLVMMVRPRPSKAPTAGLDGQLLPMLLRWFLRGCKILQGPVLCSTHIGLSAVQNLYAHPHFSEAALHSPCASCSQARHSPLLDSLMIPSLPSFRCQLKCQRAISWLCYTTLHPNYSLSVGPALFFLWSVTINYRLSFVSSNRNVGVIKRGALFPAQYPGPETVHRRHSENMHHMNEQRNEWVMLY